MIVADDVKAQAAEVLWINSKETTRAEARMIVGWLAEAGLLADGRQWEPIGGFEWCEGFNTPARVGHLGGHCPGPHRPLAVAIEAAAPTPRYTAVEDEHGDGWWLYEHGEPRYQYPQHYPGGAEAAARAEMRRLNEMEDNDD